MSSAAELIRLLKDRGASIATAESLTGGALCAALVDVPGASAVLRGGVIAYSPEAKHDLLGVDPDLIEAAGVVSEDVAEAMAAGIRERAGATLGVSTTGVAGPEPHGGRVPGTVCIAVSGPRGALGATVMVTGDRAAVRSAAVEEALRLVIDALDTDVTVL